MRSPNTLLLVALVFVVNTVSAARAEEPFFKKGDVIAILGGEDMVALGEYGYLELLLTRALPDYHLRFRNLAWEGDTVFEQRRDPNFPTWGEQLEKIGATVVLCQFGQMESLAGKEKLPEFIGAYEKLLARFSGGGKRRVLILEPFFFAQGNNTNDVILEWDEHNTSLGLHLRAIHTLAERLKVTWIRTASIRNENERPVQRDFCHLNQGGQVKIARQIVSCPELRLGPFIEALDARYGPFEKSAAFFQRAAERRKAEEPLLVAITAKNRLWLDYWGGPDRAFLAGNPANQPSRRDDLAQGKRLSPAEREKLLPLIKAKEREIDALAEELAQP